MPTTVAGIATGRSLDAGQSGRPAQPDTLFTIVE
jgi:hypothetical protein